MLVRPPEEEHAGAPVEPEPAEFGHTMVYSVDREARRMDAPAAFGGRAFLVGGGKRTVLSGSRVVIGRSRDCDVTLDDPNVSRRHAELRREGATWVVSDLGSTNGVKVNGHRVNDHPLTPGDQITLGLERLTFEVE
jgi:pSer/pThr/pTyr-binding forkhead associated (FHA) protein